MANQTIDITETQQFTIGPLKDKRGHVVIPEGTLDFASSNEDAVTVINNGDNTGLAKGVAAGSGTITLTDSANGDTWGIDVTVTEPPESAAIPELGTPEEQP